MGGAFRLKQIFVRSGLVWFGLVWSGLVWSTSSVFGPRLLKSGLFYNEINFICSLTR